MYVRMYAYMFAINSKYVCMFVGIYKALRSAGGLRRPLRSLRKKIHQITRSGQKVDD